MTTDLQIMDMSLPISSVDAYIARINRIPMLTPEQEKSLATQLQQNQDLAAAQRLVMAHLRFVVKIARGYKGYGLSMADLIQEGNIGLMKAVKRFDPDMGVRLVSFAVHWIKAEIQEFVLRNWRIVKVATTKAQRKLFFNLRKTKQRLGWLQKDELHEVANDLDIDPKIVQEMETRLSARDVSFDTPATDEHDEDTHSFAPMLYLEDHRYDPAKLLENSDHTEQSQDKLSQALTLLDPRSQQIVTERWLTEPKATLHELAERYQVSAERIRQLEQSAMKKLRTAIEAVA